VATYNMILSLTWTALFLTPISIYCYTFLTLKTTYILLAVSLIPGFFPNSFFNRIQLSRKASFYRKIGVLYINAFVQNGSIVNRTVKRIYPNFKVVSKNKASIRKQYYQTYLFEKFHFSLFLFFILVTIHVGAENKFDWVLCLTVCNIFYNVYPNLLQQYIRLKLRSSVI
jgi:hypothetical protein